MTQKQLEPYYLIEVLWWELYSSYTKMFRDQVDNSALFGLRLIFSWSRQAFRN